MKKEKKEKEMNKEMKKQKEKEMTKKKNMKEGEGDIEIGERDGDVHWKKDITLIPLVQKLLKH